MVFYLLEFQLSLKSVFIFPKRSDIVHHVFLGCLLKSLFTSMALRSFHSDLHSPVLKASETVIMSSSELISVRMAMCINFSSFAQTYSAGLLIIHNAVSLILNNMS